MLWADGARPAALGLSVGSGLPCTGDTGVPCTGDTGVLGHLGASGPRWAAAGDATDATDGTGTSNPTALRSAAMLGLPMPTQTQRNSPCPHASQGLQDSAFRLTLFQVIFRSPNGPPCGHGAWDGLHKCRQFPGHHQTSITKTGPCKETKQKPPL